MQLECVCVRVPRWNTPESLYYPLSPPKLKSDAFVCSCMSYRYLFLFVSVSTIRAHYDIADLRMFRYRHAATNRYNYYELIGLKLK